MLKTVPTYIFKISFENMFFVQGRHDISQGVLKIKGLVKKDHGIYQCVVSSPFI